MRQLKGAIQDTADRINDPMVNDNISAIKAMVIIDKNIQEAIQTYKDNQEKATASKQYDNTIVTGEDIRREMNREID